jgi:D-glycero-D-manno-heptose 1,7-bisphosphate phosphatase
VGKERMSRPNILKEHSKNPSNDQPKKQTEINHARSASSAVKKSGSKSEPRQHKALFLDRDGVINVDHGYVGHYEHFDYVDGIFEVVKMYASAGYKIVIVTNQSGIARGRYTEADFHVLMDKVKADFADNGVYEVAVYFCPHHVEGSEPEYAINCSCRKPKPGMLLQASQELSISLKDSVLIGDSWRDIEAAHAAGLKKSIYFTENAMPADSTIEGVRKIQSLQQLTAVE